MAVINPSFGKELKKYGAFDFNACYNCGNCTATCSLSTETDSFPREMVRYGALGLEDEIKSSLKPWMCYYCGECSLECPRKADPGELMMSLRRWLTAKYDWTGLSGLLYKSVYFSIFMFLLIIAGIMAFGSYADFHLPTLIKFGHTFEMAAIAGVFTIILLPNIIRMWKYTMHKDSGKSSFSVYFKSMSELFIHMFTQKRTLGCDNNQTRWFEHLILVFGYLALLFTTVFLDWFSSHSLFIVILGYLESVVVFGVTFDFVRRRMIKEKEISSHSQPSDWLFVVWLFLMGFTAFFVRLFIDLDIIRQNAWLYMVHIIILAQWALLIVPFGKWTHFMYRSFAMYFDRVNKLS